MENLRRSITGKEIILAIKNLLRKKCQTQMISLVDSIEHLKTKKIANTL